MPLESKTPSILVVDDDPGLSFLIEQTLCREQWQTSTANSGAAALKWLEANRPDLILLDLKLQDIGAGELITRLSAADRLAPFIIITGQGHEKVAVEMMKRGALDYVTKDVQFLDLLPEIVRRALEQIHQQRRLLAAEGALRNSYERLAKVLEVQTVGVMFWDLTTGRLVDANDTFLKMMGYSRTDVETHELTWQKFTPPEYHEASLAEIRKFEASGRVGPYEKEYFCKDGARRWLLFAGSSLGGNQCVEFCVDLSDLKKAEQALRKSEIRERARAEELAALLDAVPLPVFIAHDSECRHITGNRAADLLLRNPKGAEASLSAAENVKPRHFKALRHGQELPNDELPAQRAARGIPVDNLDFSLVFDDGGELEVLGYGAPLRDENGQPRGAVNVLVDITDRKRMELEILEIAEREQVRIGQDLHDGLGQQLTATELLCETLKADLARKNADLVPRMEQIGHILRGAISETRLISHGLAPIKMTPDGLMEALQQLSELVSKTSRLECILECPTPVHIEDSGSAIHMFRIAQEATNNAIKHGKAQRITIRLTETAESIRLAISDDGKGFALKPDAQKGIGLEVMRHRANVIGAKFELHSTPQGATILCERFKEL